MIHTAGIAHKLRPHLLRTIRILFVIDGALGIVEDPGAFGVGRVKRLIHGLRRGCHRFHVDSARRSGSEGEVGDALHITTTFRFDDLDTHGEPILHRYDEVWLFGFDQEFQDGLDDAELRVLTRWMNDGGGVFATGDHEDLGAAMCKRIPRVRTMRRWTEADGVPPANAYDRLDTNRPQTSAEALGQAPMTFAHERDTTPQRITWIPSVSFSNGLFLQRRPHPILCHPSLGPIDVMPDHPHEGRTRTAAEIPLDGTYNFGDGVHGDEYPSAGGKHPGPRMIARGVTWPAPPTNKDYKGDTGEFEFPMITVYDGRSVGVGGRVVVDSTWHHWLDLNIARIEADSDDTNWRKISRYYENIADWLIPAHRRRDRCWFVARWFEYPLIEEHPHLGDHVVTANLARQLYLDFQGRMGPCATTAFVHDLLCERFPWLCDGLAEVEVPPKRPGCLTCPPFEALEVVVFEALARASMRLLTELPANALVEPAKAAASLERRLAALGDEAIAEAVERFAEERVSELTRELAHWKRATSAERPKRKV